MFSFLGLKGSCLSSESERPFVHLFKAANVAQVLQSREKLTNGVHNELANNANQLETSCSKQSSNNFSVGSDSGADIKEEKLIVTSEEKTLENRDPVVTQASDSCLLPESASAVENSRSVCGSSDLDTSNGHFNPECCPDNVDGKTLPGSFDGKTSLELKANCSELRTTCSSESSNGHFNLDPSSNSTPPENDFVDGTLGCQGEHATAATSTAESLTTTFSSLSTAVQPSTSTSTLSSVSPFDLPSTSVSETAIPLPPPIPPPPPQSSAVRGYGDGQVKTGVMGGSQSDTTHLPFSEAIRAAASKGADIGFDGLDNSDELAHVGLTGLENLGNTCYLNSIVQCLANTRQLRDFFLGKSFPQGCLL